MDRIIRYTFLIILFIVFESTSNFTMGDDFITSIAFHLFKWFCGFIIVREAYRDGVKDAEKVKI